MAQVNKISSFKSFTEVKSQEATMKLRETNNAKRQETVGKIGSILDEMGLTSLSELDEEKKQALINKMFGNVSEDEADNIEAAVNKLGEPKKLEEGNAFIFAAGKAKQEGKTEFEFNGKKYKVTIKKDTGLKEGNAFGDAVKKAKEDGEKEFEFDGKTYKVTESAESIDEARTIAKIQYDWSKLTTTMQATAQNWKAAEGDAKEMLLGKLKEMTAQKKALETELNSAIADKDKDIELVVSEAFYRLPKDVIGTELYVANQNLQSLYGRAQSGNDIDPKELDAIVKLLQQAKSLTKKFNNKEEVAGTVYEAEVNEAEKFKSTKDFLDFCEEIDGMPEQRIKRIMGKDYIDTPGGYRDEADDYNNDIEEYMISNMGKSNFNELKTWWETNVKESNNVEENQNPEQLKKLKEIKARQEEQKRLKKLQAKRAKVNEAEVKSDDEFKEYAMTVLKKAFGDDFDEAKAGEVVDGILKKCGDDYGAAVGMLTSSLGESVVNEAASVKSEAISRLADFFRINPYALSKFNFDGKDNIKELTKVLNSTSDEGTKLYYDTCIKLAKKDLGIDESVVTEAFDANYWEDYHDKASKMKNLNDPNDMQLKQEVSACVEDWNDNNENGEENEVTPAGEKKVLKLAKEFVKAKGYICSDIIDAMIAQES